MSDLKSIQNKLIGTDDERAVSPVIGVILMVAITVILAAVIAAFVLDMGSGVEQNAQAGANVNLDSTNDKASVTYNSKQNADYIEVALTDSDGNNIKYQLDSPGSKVTLSAVHDDNGADGTQGNADDNIHTSQSSSGSISVVSGSVESTSTTRTNHQSNSGFSLYPNEDNDVSVVVTAVKGDTSTVIAEKSDTV